MNPFNIREAGQTIEADAAERKDAVSIPSTSGKPVRLGVDGVGDGGRVSIPSTSGKPVRHATIKTKIDNRVSIPSTSGKPVRRSTGEGAGVMLGLNPFNIREAGQTTKLHAFVQSLQSQSLQHQGSRSDWRSAMTSAEPRSQSLQHQGSRSDTLTNIYSPDEGLNPFNIREAGQTEAGRADDNRQSCMFQTRPAR